MHVTDWFATILRATLDWLSGSADASPREGHIYWMGPEMYGVKWRNFKLVLVAQMYMQDAASKLPTPRLINLTTDRQEREPLRLRTSSAGLRPTSTGWSASTEQV